MPLECRNEKKTVQKLQNYKKEKLWGYSKTIITGFLVCLVVFLQKKTQPCEVPSNGHQRHNTRDAKWTMDLILYQKILPSIFPLLF